MAQNSSSANREGARSAWGAAVVIAALALLNTYPTYAAENEMYKTASGIAVYLGLIPAEIVKGHSPRHEERSMHDGSLLGGPHAYHVVAAVFAEDSGQRIENARVSAGVAGLGMVSESVTLEPMTIAGTITYGAFLDLPRDLYTIRVKVERPGVASPVTFDFEFDHRAGIQQ